MKRGRLQTQHYAFNNIPGCTQQRRAHSTGTLVGVYYGPQAGIDTDPTRPWVTVCEKHSTHVAHSTLTLARIRAADPHEWCENCRT